MDSGKSGPGRVTGKGKCRGRNESGISAYLRSRKSPVLGGKWKMKLRRTEVDKGPGNLRCRPRKGVVQCEQIFARTCTRVYWVEEYMNDPFIIYV